MGCDSIPLKLKTRKDELFAHASVKLTKREERLSPLYYVPQQPFPCTQPFLLAAVCSWRHALDSVTGAVLQWSAAVGSMKESAF